MENQAQVRKNNIKLTVNIAVKCTTTLPVKFILIKYKGGGGYSKNTSPKILISNGKGEH